MTKTYYFYSTVNKNCLVYKNGKGKRYKQDYSMPTSLTLDFCQTHGSEKLFPITHQAFRDFRKTGKIPERKKI